METIFHEKQEGSLCAQHCLNALLQGEYFTAVDLATIAQQIDEEEKSRMAEGGTNSEGYRRFLQQPSGNVDDSGYFSVQVIANALKVWGLELIPFKSQHPVAQQAQKDPTKLKAFICNYRDHWLTIRKIGYQWFNLNSLLTGPELISDTYLSLFLAQLIQEGYSIFIVLGTLPDCTSDRVLCQHPAVQKEKPRFLSEVRALDDLTPEEKRFTMMSEEEEDKTLQHTLRLSLENSMQYEDQQLQAALSQSLTDYNNKINKMQSASHNPGPSTSTAPVIESSGGIDRIATPDDMTEQEMLEVALKMSMET